MELYKEVNVVVIPTSHMQVMDIMQKISFLVCGKIVIYLHWGDVN